MNRESIVAPVMLHAVQERRAQAELAAAQAEFERITAIATQAAAIANSPLEQLARDIRRLDGSP